MPPKEVLPTLGAASFTCPHCGALAHQTWDAVYRLFGKKFEETQNEFGQKVRKPKTTATVSFIPPQEEPFLSISQCVSCAKLALWVGDRIVQPRAISIQPPAENMPQDVRDLYLEARAIASESPRAAAALLRLALEKLLAELGSAGKNLFERIQNLEKVGVPTRMIQAMTALRVAGNNAVHPGEIDLAEPKELANQMFLFLNYVVEFGITAPAHVDKFMAAHDAKKNVPLPK